MVASSTKKKLAKYRAKRDFKKTSEPSGKEKTIPGHSYLIQKHAARRLHYDFRLEMDGVLKSWAVTRGPSLNPEDKRLAVHVEDHPLAYGSFEGTIPKGEYGGGTVMLWDQGSWEPIGDAARSYKKGNMTFELHGKRLKGRWHLVRMRGRERDKRENWLLIKGKDKYAKAEGEYAIGHFQKSVTTERKMEEIAEGNEEWHSNKKTKSKPEKKQAKKKAAKSRNLPAPPDFVAPQLATLTMKPPKGEKWVHEIKFDGYRLLVRISNGKIDLITRANNNWTHKFKSLAGDLMQLDVQNALIDGEVVHQSSDGSMSFHGLQHALSKGTTENLNFYAFDLLFLDGKDYRKHTLLERKEALKKILEGAPANIHYSEHFDEPGDKVLSHACHIALEGIVSKRTDLPYHSGRDDTWMKSKCTKEQEVVIGGFTTQPKHPGILGALLTGYYEKGSLLYSGKVGTGFNNEEARLVLKKLQKLQTKSPAFASVPTAAKRGATWVKPELVAQIHFSEWTPDGHMRHPSYLGLREDKPAKEVVREKAVSPPASVKMKKAAPRPVSKKNGKQVIAGVALSHPDKELFAKDHITKLDLAEYYEKIAPRILPHIANRPISLVRCPEGEGQQCFFQRHAKDTSPFIKPVYVKSKGEKEPYMAIEDIHGLIALIQMGTLEIHVWGSGAGDPDLPDRIVFDFDPAPDVKFAAVKDAALAMRDRLKKLKLASFVKTTGGKGLHVVVPFAKGHTWDEVKNFSRAMSELMARDDPAHFTINSRKDKRGGKIYIDYLRNGIGASAVAPYSCRAKPGAPIAMPVTWNDLPKLKSANAFTMKDALRSKKDPWTGFFKIKQKLPINEILAGKI